MAKRPSVSQVLLIKEEYMDTTTKNSRPDPDEIKELLQENPKAAAKSSQAVC